MKSDIEIARETPLAPITAIAEKMGVPGDALEPYGRYCAKIPEDLIDEEKLNKEDLAFLEDIKKVNSLDKG